MGGVRMKKGQTGEAAKYISRSKAARKLQVNLYSFNRLCIIKGIYPIEPKHRIRAQGGNSTFKTLYLKKDIKFLLHDPLIWTMRDEHSSFKKLKSAQHLRSMTKIDTIKRNKPIYRLDQNVLERYPSFLDAVKDLADPLTMVFLFARLGSMKPIQEHHVTRCQRLCSEFMTFVIETRCLTKAFISTKGYYYECDILGRKVVWTVPHNCVTTVPYNADLKIMKHFLEFNIAMLGFVNFRLLTNANFRYPLKPAVIPKLTGSAKKDLDNFKNLILSLNYPMERSLEKDINLEDKTEDTKKSSELLEGSTELTKKVYSGAYADIARKNLFEGMKFFLGFETNRESLTMVIKSCGGEVSWPSDMFPCSTFKADSQSVTHQIVDRPKFENKHLSRYYVQPQWVYDSVNAATLQPTQAYLPGNELPPHVCPFLKNVDGWYVPPEEETFRRLLAADPAEKDKILEELYKEEQEKASLMREAKYNADSSDEEPEDSDFDGEEDQEMDAEIDESVEETDADKTVDDTSATKTSKSDKKGKTAKSEKANAKTDKKIVKIDTKAAKKASNTITPEQDDDKMDDNNNNEEEENKDDETELEAPKKGKKQEKKKQIRRGRELIINEKAEAQKEEDHDEKMRKFMIHKRNKNLYNKLQAKEKRTERRSSYLKDRREAHEALQRGEITQEVYDYPEVKERKLTVHERRRNRYKASVKTAVAFAKSPANKNRNN